MIVATVLVERHDGRLLVVWNRKFRGWTLPGGKLEPGETPEDAAARELAEETGILADRIDLVRIYSAAPPASEGPAAPTVVHVHRLNWWSGYGPRETEAGCPVSFFTRDDFLASCPVREFYEGCFAVIVGAP